ncbi:RNA exonuclease 4 [Strongyloides ratti]|uniref:RNA exonuclease 4 n=1 Tax=Strongyloides ratti TaxID=34506 RepID=A0A090LMV8_STRRB|nr:RNA exonuclease 4 [Strongyloides ratti]CEF69503.1 RNA exonuclease 4 [Strongyloides ratti]
MSGDKNFNGNSIEILDSKIENNKDCQELKDLHSIEYLYQCDFTEIGGVVNIENVTNIVALDCEFVGVGIKGKNNALARVSIVSDKREIIYDKYVKVLEPVVDYRTYVSGITPKHLEKGENYFTVRNEVKCILDGRIIVGHDLRSDLKALKMPHFPNSYIRDTARFPGFDKYKSDRERSISLKNLMKRVFQIDIQRGSHDSVEDAKSAMRLYNTYKNDFECRYSASKYSKNLQISLKDY